MPNYLASYDLSDQSVDAYTEFRDAAIKTGWGVWVLNPEKVWHLLPNATLVGDFSSHDVAVSSLRKARSLTSTKLGRDVLLAKWVVVDYRFCNFESDTRTASGG